MLGLLLCALARRHRRTSTNDPRNVILMNGVLVGDKSSGKTRIFDAFQRRQYFASPSTSVDYASRRLEFDDRDVYFKLVDTPGDSLYREDGKPYWKEDIVFVVFSFGNKKSFDNVMEWVNLVKSAGSPRTTFYLIGAQADLLEGAPEVTEEDVEKFLQENEGIFSGYGKCSAETTGWASVDKVLKDAVERRFDFYDRTHSAASFKDALQNLFTAIRTGHYDTWTKTDQAQLLDNMKAFMKYPMGMFTCGIEENICERLGFTSEFFRGVLFSYVMKKRGSYPRYWKFASVRNRRLTFLRPVEKKEVKTAWKKAESFMKGLKGQTMWDSFDQAVYGSVKVGKAEAP